MLAALLSARRIKLMLEPIYVYRQEREGSATSKVTLKRVKDTMNFVIKWYNKINNSEIDNELKKYIIDFIRYEYFVVLGVANLLSKNEKKTVMNELKKYKFLFKNGYGKKEKIVKKVYSIFGFNITCALMGFWIKNKNKICK